MIQKRNLPGRGKVEISNVVIGSAEKPEDKKDLHTLPANFFEKISYLLGGNNVSNCQKQDPRRDPTL